MSISREEAIAEARRRGLNISGEQTARPQISREDALLEAKRRGLSIPTEEPQFSEHPIISGARAFNTKFDRVFHGMLQPLLEGGYLGQNLSKASKDVASQREEALRKSEEVNPFATGLGGTLGEVGINLPAAIAGGALFSGAKAIPAFLRGILGGAAGAGAIGGSQYTMDDESRLTNALIGAGEGGMFGALPSIGQAAAATGRYLKNIPKALQPAKDIAERIAVTDKNSVKQMFNKRYNNLFKQAEEHGISEIRIPKINEKRIYKHLKDEETSALKEFLKSPTLKNAHEADKDLGNGIRRLEKIQSGPLSLSTTKGKGLSSAIKAQSRIQNSINKTLSKKAGPELAKEYSAIKEAYRNEYIPYKNTQISKYLAKPKKLTPEGLVKRLGKNEEFKAQLGHKYPEIGVRRTLPWATGGAIGLGGMGLGFGPKMLSMLLGKD